jgi:hypothetical protein
LLADCNPKKGDKTDEDFPVSEAADIEWGLNPVHRRTLRLEIKQRAYKS